MISSGIEIARQQAATTGIVIYIAHRDRMLVLGALKAGTHGIVLKWAPLSDLIRAVHTVADGNLYVDPTLAGVLINPGATKSLGERERRVLRLLADGHRNEVIGETLSISANTVRVHIRNAARKLQVTTKHTGRCRGPPPITHRVDPMAAVADDVKRAHLPIVAAVLGGSSHAGVVDTQNRATEALQKLISYAADVPGLSLRTVDVLDWTD